MLGSPKQGIIKGYKTMPPSDATASEVTHRDGELGVRAH